MTERKYERFLRTVIARCLGTPVVHVDDGSRDSMYDAEVRYSDGRIAAVEFTTVGQRTALEMQALPTELEVPGTPYWWTLRHPPQGVSWRDIRRYVPALIALLDERGMRDASGLRYELPHPPSLDWLHRHHLTLRHFGATPRGGRVHVLPEAMGGVVDTEFHGLNAWVKSLQRERWWSDNVEKLARSLRAEST